MTRGSGNNAALEEAGGEWEGLWAGDEGIQLSQLSFLQIGLWVFFCAKHSQAQSSHGSPYWGTWSSPLGATNKVLKDSSNQGCLKITRLKTLSTTWKQWFLPWSHHSLLFYLSSTWVGMTSAVSSYSAHLSANLGAGCLQLWTSTEKMITGRESRAVL